MIKTLLLSAITLLSLTASAQRWETIKGSGNIKKETREVGAFTGLLSQGPMDVEISYGKENTITIEADDNLLPYIETAVENNKLIIKTKKNVGINSRHNLMVHVSMTTLSTLQLSGSGNINGSGDFSNDGKTDIGISGSGNIKMRFDHFNELELGLSGSGNMILKGNNVNNITAAVSGSGNIECADINTNDVFARISGSGNIKVTAQKSLDAKISGSGNVYYKGVATNITTKKSGSGAVIKM